MLEFVDEKDDTFSGGSNSIRTHSHCSANKEESSPPSSPPPPQVSFVESKLLPHLRLQKRLLNVASKKTARMKFRDEIRERERERIVLPGVETGERGGAN